MGSPETGARAPIREELNPRNKQEIQSYQADGKKPILDASDISYALEKRKSSKEEKYTSPS